MRVRFTLTCGNQCHASWVYHSLSQTVHIQLPGWQRLYKWNDCLKTAILSCIVTSGAKRRREGWVNGETDGGTEREEERERGERWGLRERKTKTFTIII